MSYTREQRAANAAKAAETAAAQGPAAVQEAPPVVEQSAPEPSESATTRVVGERPKPRNNPRDELFAEVEARHDRTSGNEVPAAAPKADAPAPTAAPQAETPAAPAPVADAAPAAPEPIPMVRVKVDGEEFEVPQTEVDEAGSVRAYQTQRAADNRLKKANELVAETRRTHEQIAQWAAAQARAQPPAPPQPSPVQLINAIRAGTEEEATAAFNQMMTMARGPQVDPGAIQNQTLMAFNIQNARNKFKNEFSDIVTNPIVLEAAVALDRRTIAQLPQGTNLAEFDFEDHYRRIGNQVRNAFGRPSQPASVPAAQVAPAAPTGSTPSQPSAREERKSSIVNLPTAAARAELPREENPGTPEEQRLAAIASMNKARGKLNG